MHLADAFIQSDLHCIQVTVFVHLRNTNEDIFDAFWELSDPPIDSKDLYTINVQKRSKEIGKTIHVTSGVQP